MHLHNKCFFLSRICLINETIFVSTLSSPFASLALESKVDRLQTFADSAS
jgi:hypothetical protein